jgi:hypothetical protein
VSTCSDKLAAYNITARPDEMGLISATVDVESIDELRTLLDVGFDAKQRQAHYNALFKGIESQGSLLDRVFRYLVGNDDLSEDDRGAIDAVFPLEVDVTTAPGPITVNKPVDLSSDTGHRVVCFTDVTMEQGGYFSCSATTLEFTCDTLTRSGNTGGSAADFNILGRQGQAQPTPATPPAPAQAGQGTNSDCSSPGIKGGPGGKGNNGTLYTNGSDGVNGNDGQPSQTATIVINHKITLAPPVKKLTFFGQSGPGGNGGDGGKGGPGQQGGKGGGGSGCCGECSDGGVGGDGGKGGTGGKAGNGGNGVDTAGNITVAAPKEFHDLIDYSKADAPPGNPGNPGAGGDPGDPGPGGSGGQGSKGTSCNDGPKGGGGAQGDRGAYGSKGTGTGKPPGFQVII